MTATSFDSARAVRFDLPRGAVQAGSDDERVILIPSSALDDLVLSVPPEAVDALGRSLGTSIGKRAVARVPDARSASVEEFVTQLAGEAAVAGIGVITVERWGRALVVVIEASPLASAWLAPVVASALSVAFGRNVATVLLSRDTHDARVLVASQRGVDRVRDWIASGTPWGEALARLHTDGARE
jgi:hypothetical protein